MDPRPAAHGGGKGTVLGDPAGPPPILVTASVIGVAREFEHSDELLDLLVESEEDSLREHNDRVRDNPENPIAFRHVASVMNALGYERSSEPPALILDEEVEQRVAKVPPRAGRLVGPPAKTICRQMLGRR